MKINHLKKLHRNCTEITQETEDEVLESWTAKGWRQAKQSKAKAKQSKSQAKNCLQVVLWQNLLQAFFVLFTHPSLTTLLSLFSHMTEMLEAQMSRILERHHLILQQICQSNKKHQWIYPLHHPSLMTGRIVYDRSSFLWLLGKRTSLRSQLLDHQLSFQV